MALGKCSIFYEPFELPRTSPWQFLIFTPALAFLREAVGCTLPLAGTFPTLTPHHKECTKWRTIFIKAHHIIESATLSEILSTKLYNRIWTMNSAVEIA